MIIDQTKDITAYLPSLTEMLVETVAQGASIGFHPPLPPQEAIEYWQQTQEKIRAGSTLMLVAHTDGKAVGTVQLALESKPNARHRAEVQKLMVHPAWRSGGVGRKLMQALEKLADEHNRTLLMLDTDRGSAAEGLYQRMAYNRVGDVPDYTVQADGRTSATVIFYKHLTEAN